MKRSPFSVLRKDHPLHRGGERRVSARHPHEDGTHDPAFAPREGKAGRSLHRSLQVTLASLIPLLLVSCDGERWLEDRLAEADSLSTTATCGLLLAGNFFSEDLTCISAGVLAAKGTLPYLVAALACALGVWISDSVLYLIGRLGRRGLLDRAPLRWIVKREQVERAAAGFERHGVKLIVLSRFMPGSRLPIYVGAGLLRYPYGKYAAWMALAAALWAPAMVALSMWLGDALFAWLDAYETAAWIAMPLVVLGIWLMIRLAERAVAKRASSDLEHIP